MDEKMKADQEDVNRILNNLLLQGNGEELHNWLVINWCWKCYYKSCVDKIKKEFETEQKG